MTVRASLAEDRLRHWTVSGYEVAARVAANAPTWAALEDEAKDGWHRAAAAVALAAANADKVSVRELAQLAYLRWWRGKVPAPLESLPPRNRLVWEAFSRHLAILAGNLGLEPGEEAGESLETIESDNVRWAQGRLGELQELEEKQR